MSLDSQVVSPLNPNIIKCTIPKHADAVLTQMQAHFKDQELCDVVLTGSEDDQSVAAHRLLLSACSPYFKAMFTGSMSESRQNKIVLEGIYGHDLKALLHHCYTGLIEVDKDDLQRLLATASFLQLDAVVETCCSLLRAQIDCSNCLAIGLFAEKHSFNDLRIRAHACTCRNFMKVCKSQEFLELSAEQLVTFIANDDLGVSNEEDVFSSVMSWIQHDPDNRNKYFAELLGLVRMQLLKPSFIEEHVEPVCNTPECRKLFMEAMQWHLVPEERTTVASERMRKCAGVLMAAYFVDRVQSIQLETYCPVMDRWYTIATIPSNEAPELIYALPNNVVLQLEDSTLQLKSLNPYDSKVERKLPVPYEDYNYGIGVVDDYIYIIGGSFVSNRGKYVKRLNLLDPVGKFASVASMNMARHCPGVAVLGKHLYAIGGGSDSGILDAVERYDTLTDTWTLRASINTRRHKFGIASGNGFLYVVGGNTGYSMTRSVERYDPDRDKWTTICCLNQEIEAISCAILGERLMVVGFKSSTNYVEEFDLVTLEWCKKASLLENSYIQGCQVVT